LFLSLLVLRPPTSTLFPYTTLFRSFGTKNRERWLTPAIERIWSYLGGIARENKMNSMRVGGVEDHIHMLVSIPPVLPESSFCFRSEEHTSELQSRGQPRMPSSA